MVQQERERLPIDPESLDLTQEGQIFSRGRDQFDGCTFTHIRNVGSLEETVDAIRKEKENPESLFAHTVLVPGAGVYKYKSRTANTIIRNYERLGMWVIVNAQRLRDKYE